MSDPRRVPQGDKADNQIDENLKRIYEKLVDDDVPDRFAKLLEQLREREKK